MAEDIIRKDGGKESIQDANGGSLIEWEGRIRVVGNRRKWFESLYGRRTLWIDVAISYTTAQIAHSLYLPVLFSFYLLKYHQELQILSTTYSLSLLLGRCDRGIQVELSDM